MKLKTLRHMGAFIALLVASIIVTYLTENLFFGVITFVGGGFLYLSGDAFIYQCRMLSTCFFADIGRKGHSSLIEADMFSIPSPHNGEPSYKVMMTGGSSVPILPFHGFGPVFICPNKYVKRDFHGAVLAIADWFKTKFEYLHPSFQDALVNRLEHFNPNTTEIYFADSSPINEKMKADVNIDLSKRAERLQATINTIATENEDLRKEIDSNMKLLKNKQKDWEEEKPRAKILRVIEE